MTIIDNFRIKEDDFIWINSKSNLIGISNFHNVVTIEKREAEIFPPLNSRSSPNDQCVSRTIPTVVTTKMAMLLHKMNGCVFAVQDQGLLCINSLVFSGSC